METITIIVNEVNETVTVTPVTEVVNITVDETIETVNITSTGGDDVSVDIVESTSSVQITDNSTIEDINVEVVESSDNVKILIGEEIKTWINYVTEYEPSTETNIDGGKVIQMNGAEETVYRFVPEPYTYNKDEIYENFNGLTLTNLITKRL